MSSNDSSANNESMQMAVFETACKIQTQILVSAIRDKMPEKNVAIVESFVYYLNHAKHFIYIIIIDTLWHILSPHEKDIQAKNPEVWAKISIPGDVQLKSIVYSGAFSDKQRSQMLSILKLAFSSIKSLRECIPDVPAVSTPRDAIVGMFDPKTIENANAIISVLKSIGITKSGGGGVTVTDDVLDD